MKKNYIAPSVETYMIKIHQIIATSNPTLSISSEGGTNIAEGKSVNFAEDENDEFWDN